MGNNYVSFAYAKSKLSPAQYSAMSLSGMGNYTGSYFNNLFQTIMDDQQARLGRFLTYKQLLRNLLDRANAIKSVDARGKDLVGRCNAALKNQADLESQGMTLIGTVSVLKDNPIVKFFVDGGTNADQASSDVYNRFSQIISSLKNLSAQSASLNTSLKSHESTVSRLQKDVVSVEGELSGRGILNKISAAGGGIKSMFLYAAIAAAAVAVIVIAPKVMGKARG